MSKLFRKKMIVAIFAGTRGKYVSLRYIECNKE